MSFSTVAVGKAQRANDSQYEKASQIFDDIVNIDYHIMDGAAKKSPVKVIHALDRLRNAFPNTLTGDTRNRIQQEEGQEALELWDHIQSFLTQYSNTFSEAAKPNKEDYWALAGDWKKLLTKGDQYFQVSVKRKTPNSQLMKDLVEDKGRVASIESEIIIVASAWGLALIGLSPLFYQNWKLGTRSKTKMSIKKTEEYTKQNK